MIKHKWIGLVSALLMTASVLWLGVGYFTPSAFAAVAGTAQPAYAAAMDKTKVLDIQIIADEKEWADMLASATAEEYIQATVVINGNKIKNVGIRPKGNSSLSMVASDSTTDRYSFKIEFDHYITGQTWLGLDKLAVNNMQGDATYMKEYLSYDLMAYAGVAAPLYTFSSISVNGEAWGFYLAVEVLEDSYAARVYGSDYGKLYKPESMGMRGNGQMNEFIQGMQDGDEEQTNPWQQNAPTQGDTAFPGQGQVPAQGQNQGTTSAQGQNQSEIAPPAQGQGQNQGGITPPTQGQGQNQGGNTPPTQGQGQNQGGFTPPTQGQGDRTGNAANNVARGFGGQSGGSTLQYTDDEISSYSAIFDNAVFKSTDRDYARVISSLKKLSAGEDLDSVVDVEATLKYFAAHTVIVNLDSYVSNMSHNYYLYEKDGQLTMLPWDFNLAFGGFQSGSASAIVNFPIDTPVSGISLEDRPILAKLLEVPEYMELYHGYLRDIVDGYFNSGLFLRTIDELDALIASYVAADPSAFYDFSAYQSGVAELKKLGTLRAQSIEGQLDGSIPATTAGQTENPEALVDASGISLSALGSMGGGFGGVRGENAEENGVPNQNGVIQGFNRDNIEKAMEILQAAENGELTDEQLAQLKELGFTEEQITMFTSGGQGGFPAGGGRAGFTPGNGNNPFAEGGQTGTGTTPAAASVTGAGGWVVLGVSTLLLLAGLAVVIFYRRRRAA